MTNHCGRWPWHLTLSLVFQNLVGAAPLGLLLQQGQQLLLFLTRAVHEVIPGLDEDNRKSQILIFFCKTLPFTHLADAFICMLTWSISFLGASQADKIGFLFDSFFLFMKCYVSAFSWIACFSTHWSSVGCHSMYVHCLFEFGNNELQKCNILWFPLLLLVNIAEHVIWSQAKKEKKLGSEYDWSFLMELWPMITLVH